LKLEYPGYRRWLDTNARNKRVIRYDNRGSGLSDRDVASMDFDLVALDIDAVLNKLGIERFALFGTSIGSPVAIRYAATRPDRVSHLILWCGYARSSDFGAQTAALRTLQQMDWTLFTETVAHATVAGWGSSDEARQWAAFSRAAITQEGLLRHQALNWTFDLSEDLAAIRCPTLVIQRQEAILPPVEAARYLPRGSPMQRSSSLKVARSLPGSATWTS
jgi:pimeloyl-ACP methyl ester carboxylesterase